MTTNSTETQSSPSIPKQVWVSFWDYFEMFPVDPPTLPEALLNRLGIRSWALTSLTVGIGLYTIFIAIGATDGTLVYLTRNGLWRVSFIYAGMTIYLLMIQPILRHLLRNAIETFRPLLPTTERFERMVTNAYSLNRRTEWLVIILGIILELSLERPWQKPTFALALYVTIGEGLVFGLTAWHIYSALVRTKLLSMFYTHAQHLNIFRYTPPFRPIGLWSIGVVIGILGGIPLSAFFIGLEELREEPPFILYGALITSALLVVVSSKMPTSVISRISLIRAMVLFIAVAATGTIGYHQIEKWTLTESLYATIITMTTVGYGDFSPKTSQGQLFTVVLSLFAIGIAGYAASALAAFLVEGNFEQFTRRGKYHKQIAQLDNHIILCGAGQVGKQVAIEFYKTRVPFVVIEHGEMILEDLLHEVDIAYIQGDATQSEILELAGINRARGLITTLSDDKDNAFIVLSANQLMRRLNNPHLQIISRVNEDKQIEKLKRVGANLTISPHMAGGRRMFTAMLRPDTLNFLDEMMEAEQQTGQILRLEEIHVDEIKTLFLQEQLRKDQLRVMDVGSLTQLLIVAIKRASLNQPHPYIFTPKGNTALQPGDVLIVIATPEERAILKRKEATSTLKTLLSKFYSST